jgi:hypothetical protein
MGIAAFAGDASQRLGKALNFYDPVGTLSGVTTVSIVVWLAAWFILSRLWATKSVALGRINQVAFALLLVGFLLTFPPVMDFLQGK